MPQYDVTVSGKYKCQDAKGLFAWTPFSRTITLEMDSPGDINYDEISAILDLDAPDRCVSANYTIDGIFEHAAPPGTELSPELFPTDETAADSIGQLVTVYAEARFAEADGSTTIRTFRVDVSTTDTIQEVLDAVQEDIDAHLESDDSGAYAGELIGFDIVAPVYYQYSSGG